jgi:2-polyprenyl-6-methoxyphenol hydroxylase-like FAD-dependent oxidoreductase
MARVVVIGAGVSGLGAALALGRDGHEVTMVERDATPLPADPDAAFEWDRRGAPQVRHSHALLARLRNLLRDRFPDVLRDLLAAGATELRFTEVMPPTIDDPSPKEGDEDLVALACRRTTFEWVLRRSVLAEPHVQLLDGVTVEGLESEPGDPVRVTGVRTTDGVLPADIVVAANGRRSPVSAWLTSAGAGAVPESEEDTGIVYFSRFYRLRDGAEEPPREGPIGADLGYLKFAIFLGDNRTFSVTLAVGVGDHELRARLLDPATFDAAARLLPAPAPWVDPDRSEAITEVHVMARLINRLRRFVVDDRPVALGFHAVGDANICTNPLYGRGCSLGMVHADLLATAVRDHPTDPLERALAFEAATAREIEPWYDAAVNQDRQYRKDQARQAAGVEPDESDPDQFMRSILREGILPATRSDAVVFRAFLRAFNLLTPPNALMTDGEVMSRVLAVYQDRHNRPPEAPLGPDRPELFAALPG